jgi:hypothetical protein
VGTAYRFDDDADRERSEQESGETIQRERTPGALRGRLGAVDRPNLTG